jgi:AcrR family transcriptional regulator
MTRSAHSEPPPGSPLRRRSPPKQRDALRTRKRLLDAAEAIFSKAGLEGASTEAIARRAGVSKTMLFYYYQSKEQLYLEVLKRLFESVMDPATAAAVETMEPKAALREIVWHYFDAHLKRPAYAELTVREAMTYGGKHLHRMRYDLPVIGQLMRALRRGALTGEFRAVDPLKTTVSMVGMTKIVFIYRDAIERLLEQEVLSTEAAQEWREHVVDLLLNGICEAGPGRPKPAPPPGHATQGDAFTLDFVSDEGAERNC